MTMPTPVPNLETLVQTLQHSEALLIAFTQSASAHLGTVSAALAYSSIPSELWQLNAPAKAGKPTSATPSSDPQAALIAALVLVHNSHQQSAHAQQALLSDVQALAQRYNLLVRRLHTHTLRESPPSSLPTLNLQQLDDLLSSHGLTHMERYSKGNSIMGRLGRHTSAKQTWQEVNKLKLQHVAFIHGFGGSTQGQKAVYLDRFCREHDLPYMALHREDDEHPHEALESFQQQLMVWEHQPMLLVGSSLGGFFARQLAYRLNQPCLLINPSVMPQTTLLDRLPDEACKRYNAYTMCATPGMTVMLSTDDDLLDHSITQVVLRGAEFLWHDQQGHRWRDNKLIGQAILAINARRQQQVQLAH